MAYFRDQAIAWGHIPDTVGRVFWVSPGDTYVVEGRTYSASNNNNGLSPEEALRTINHALDNLVRANAGDVIVCLPGTHTPQNSAGTATSLAMDTAGVTLMGLPGARPRSVRPKTTIGPVTGDQNCNVLADDIEIAHLAWQPVDGRAAIDIGNGRDRFHLHDCYVDVALATIDAATVGVEFLQNNEHCLVENCYFIANGAIAAGLQIAGCLHTVVQNCTFMLSTGTWNNALRCAGTVMDTTIVRDCDFMVSAGTLTRAISGTGTSIASNTSVMRCYFSSSTTVSIDDFDAGDCDIAENYVAGVGATDGGVLITAIT